MDTRGQAGHFQRDLLARIDARRASIGAYLRQARPRGNRLVNTAIISSAIAAVLTAGPALGGETFSRGVANGLSLPSDSIVWRSLCLLALAVSIVAAITTNLARSQDTARRITAAESANAELEGLRTLVEFGQVPVGEAAKLYQQYVVKIPVDRGTPPGARRGVERAGSDPGSPRPTAGLGPAGSAALTREGPAAG